MTTKTYKSVIKTRYVIIWYNCLFVLLTLISMYVSEYISDYVRAVQISYYNHTATAVYRRDNNVLLLSNGNATSGLNDRFVFVYDDFIDAMNDETNWKILRTGSNISIETYDSGKNIWPLYIRTTAMIDKPSSNVSALFEWNLFDKTQKKLDPFYEASSSLYHNSNDDRNNARIIHKTTKRPLIFPKREFLLGLLHRTSKTDVVVRKARAKSVHTLYSEVDQNFNNDVKADLKKDYFIIQKGTKLCALLDVDITGGIHKPSKGAYTKAYQDFIAWYSDADKGKKTLLTIVMRVDLGRDIPHWAFLTTVAATGIWSMKALQNL